MSDRGVDPDLEPFPAPSRRRGRVALGVVALLALLLAAAGGTALVGYQRGLDPPGPPGDEVTVTIPLGSSTRRIGQLLDQAGVIPSERVFRIYARMHRLGSFQAGDYTFRTNSSIDDAVGVLRQGPKVPFIRLTIPEGLTLRQIADRVGRLEGRSADAFAAAAAGGEVRSRFQPAGSTNLEGLLLPETYHVEPKDDERAILRRLVEAFDGTATRLGLDTAAARLGITPYEAVIVASLVERETRFDDERAKVARVIYNRLQRGMLLQVDATVIYALGRSAERNVRVLFKDLEIDSPYNTYKVQGLPPTPIAAPGPASLEAALDPADGPWLYYVVTEKDGRHSFATTGAEHQRNIDKARTNGVRP